MNLVNKEKTPESDVEDELKILLEKIKGTPYSAIAPIHKTQLQLLIAVEHDQRQRLRFGPNRSRSQIGSRS